MATYENLLFSLEDGIGLLTFNRPKALNALNADTVRELSEFLEALRSGALGVVRALILTGSGEKAFVAGADISDFPKIKGAEGEDFARQGQAVFSALESLPIPVVAAVNGFALGGGLELALACHMRVLAENAVVGLPEVGLGIIPGYGGTQRLPRLIGPGLAIELITTGRKVNAADALTLGIANRVVPVGEAVNSARELVKEILRNGPVAVGLAIKAALQGLNGSLPDGLALEARLFGEVCETSDKNEGVAAFLEKRRPAFKGE